MFNRGFVLTASLFGSDGQPRAAGVDVYLLQQVNVQPLIKGAAGGDFESFPPAPTVDMNGNPLPTPIPLFPRGVGDGPPYPAGVTNGTPVAARHTQTNSLGQFSIHAALPSTLAYNAGARTDADLDPARGGRYSVGYAIIIGTGQVIGFTVNESSIVAGTLDITAILASAGV